MNRPPPFAAPLAAGLDWPSIERAARAPETELLPALLDAARLGPADAAAAQAEAVRLASAVRHRSRESGTSGLVQGLLQEFALSSQEGVALMCLAEALLRIPDKATRDALIRDKIGDGDWERHLGQSPSIFVNAAAWGLLVTGKLVATHSDTGLAAALRRLLARGGEPLIRRGIDRAMRMMGEQFVTGETIEEALATARRREAQGFRHSYDMLGEAATTADDAARYHAAYAHAIEAIGRASAGRGVVEGPGISIKLSALHPRYARAQLARVRAELGPRLLELALLARRHDIGLNIDAEESERLLVSLELLQSLCEAPALAGWDGIGFVVQAYQKRCPAAIDAIVALARRTGHRLMVRLVKGAYWDSEIKRAQQEGQAGYPVYTKKAHTDVAYLACARRLLAATDAVFPQFATHNAHTVAAIRAMAGPFAPGRYEYQCLHGMGEALYEQVQDRPCRIYAPVGTHETLLAYLVRRLLENGANTSFVNRIADPTLAIESLVEDPVETVEAEARGRDARDPDAGDLAALFAAMARPVGQPHPQIPEPRALYATRANSHGLDLAHEGTLADLAARIAADAHGVHRAAPTLPGDDGAPWRTVVNPADPDDTVGRVRDATLADVEQALAAALAAGPAWSALGADARADTLDAAADRLDDDLEALVPLLVREAGKTIANAVAEVREAVDFLRYDAAELRAGFDDATVHRPLGPVVCISPWNFPLAIFTGQVAAALAAGNAVLAKPAEQTPLVAARAVAALHAAGVPREALQLLPGAGETVGAALVDDARVEGVVFTGSTEVARILQRTLARRLGMHGRPVPLIAETGGQNALVVDSSALAEQAVADCVASAFDSAGQRCSALRLLCVQDDVADRIVGMLRGAVEELVVGDPRALATDVGPVIDAEARDAIERHVAAMRARGARVWRPSRPVPATGTFVPPTVIEIDEVEVLEREVFGPVLHVVRFARERFDVVLAAVRATGYGLTHGVHTRIDETVAAVVRSARAGNVYVNRNIVGAVVGVQPFGGEGLSGTGPKAGGPLYLPRLLAVCGDDDAKRAVARSGEPASPPVRGLGSASSIDDAARGATAAVALRAFAVDRGHADVAAACDRILAASPVSDWRALDGPTGEANLYAVLPREAVLCLASTERDRLLQLAAVLAVGSRAVWPRDAAALRETLPPEVRRAIALVDDPFRASGLDVALHHGDRASLLAAQAALAAREGPIVTLVGLAPGEAAVPLERLVVERSLSINTAAAGGNASLMTIG